MLTRSQTIKTRSKQTRVFKCLPLYKKRILSVSKKKKETYYKVVNSKLQDEDGFPYEIGKTYTREGISYSTTPLTCLLPTSMDNRVLVVKPMDNDVGITVLSEKKTSMTGTITYNGTTYHLVNGLLHRTDGPAMERQDFMAYYENNVPHRSKDLPAVITPTQELYYMRGIMMRPDPTKPCVITHTKDGDVLEWRVNNKRGRIDSTLPTVVYPNGDTEFWINDVLIDKKSKPCSLFSTLGSFLKFHL